MATDRGEVSLKTRQLNQLIHQSLARRSAEPVHNSSDSMLFLGNGHRAFPSLVVSDPVLEPVDKLAWMVISLSARSQTAHSSCAFPTYAQIARLMNVSSTSTVSRALAILRLTRWLSHCAHAREGGRFVSSVYALHDEPLPLADALHLDARYMEYVVEASSSSHARVGRIARAVSESLDQLIVSGEDVLRPNRPSEHRSRAPKSSESAVTRRDFQYTASALASLSNRQTVHLGAHKGGVDHRGHISSAVKFGPRNSKAAKGSRSRYINKTITTTSSSKPEKKTRAPTPACDSSQNLIFPAQLNANQQDLAKRYLAGIDADNRQAVLDELAGRILAETRGAKPLYDEVRYLHQLCNRVKRHAFYPNLGAKIRLERERLAREQLRHEANAKKRRDDQALEQPVQKVDNLFDELRRHLRMPPSAKKP